MAHPSSPHTSAPAAAALPAWQISYGALPAAADPNAAAPWQRPPDWLPLPAIQSGEQKLVGLFAVYPGEGNVLAVRAAGNYTVNWGDGTIEQITSPGEQIRRHQEWFGNNFWGPLERFSICPLNDPRWINRLDGTLSIYVAGERFSSSQYRIEENSATGNVEVVLTPALSTNTYRYVYGSWSWGETVIEPVRAEHRYDYATIPAASHCSRGYRQVIVTITPQPGANLTLVDLSARHSSQARSDASAPWLDLALSVPHAEAGASVVLCGYERHSTYDYLGSVERIVIHDAGGATNFNWLLYYAGSLRVFQLHNAPALEEMDGIFCYCYALEHLELPPLPLVRSASEAFYECTGLRSLSLLEMRSLRDATYLVYGCYALRELRLTGVESLTELEWVCEYAESLERVWIEEARRLRSTANLFYECSSLRQVVITGADSIENMSGMFRYCRSLEVAPELNTSFVEDMSEMFYECSALRQVPLYDTSNVTTMESMFSGCKSLVSVPLFDTRRVTTMRSMFSSCSALASLPPLDLRALESMEGMFSSCYGLVTLPLLNTEAVTTMAYCFSGCYGLLNLPALMLERVSDFNGCFSSCSSLAAAPLQRVSATISFLSCALSRSAILAIFHNLATVGGGQSIDIGDNHGARELTTDDLAIATAKGWTVLS